MSSASSVWIGFACGFVGGVSTAFAVIGALIAKQQRQRSKEIRP